MTLSTVISKIQDKQNIAKWKKEYSVISNAFNEVVADGVTICNHTQYGNCVGQGYTDEFVDAIQKKLRVVDYCGVSNVAQDKKCDNYEHYSSWDIKYKWSGTAGIYSRYKALGDSPNSGNSISAYNFSRLALLLSDGAAIYLGQSHEGPWIVVDVNNFNNGPNQFGRDVFVIHVVSEPGRYYIQALGVDDSFDNGPYASKICECGKDKGVKSASYIMGGPASDKAISGACCSAKYLME